MKKISYLLLMFLFVLCGCQEDRYMEIDTSDEEYLDPDYLNGYIYPLSASYKGMVSTRSDVDDSFEYNWENHHTIVTASGKTVNLPWSTNSMDANLTIEIANDVKKEDGWQLICHTFVPTSSISEHGRNYLFLHNLRTGKLKVLYYLEQSYIPNNSAAWQITLTGSHKWLNFDMEMALPLDQSADLRTLVTTNLMASPAKGFEEGWNGFMMEMAYDPGTNERILEIYPYNLNQANINLLTEYESYAEGVILTNSSSNPLSSLTGEVATLVGKAGNKWLSKNIDWERLGFKEAETRVIPELAASAGGAILKYGVNRILNSLTAPFSKETQTRHDLQFKTTGKAITEGTMTFLSTSPAKNLRIDFSHHKVGALGVWNLRSQPVIYIEPIAFLNEVLSTPESPVYNYSGYYYLDYSVEVNPQLKPYIVGGWTETDILSLQGHYRPKTEGLPREFGQVGMPYSGGTSGYYHNIYGEDMYNSIYRLYDMQGILYPYPWDVLQSDGTFMPVIFVPNHMGSGTGIHTYSFGTNDLFVKITKVIITEFENKRDTIMSTRTFGPKMEFMYN